MGSIQGLGYADDDQRIVWREREPAERFTIGMFWIVASFLWVSGPYFSFQQVIAPRSELAQLSSAVMLGWCLVIGVRVATSARRHWVNRHAR